MKDSEFVYFRWMRYLFNPLKIDASDKIWQAFVVFLPGHTIGVQGDQPTHSIAVDLRGFRVTIQSTPILLI
jgi:GMP synthase PP-ATPase subunit